uniref:HTH cro/C1-type domain-containing protein n=1 Tax=viral metagenome TaxID=1070528 RepID=A0A6C0HVP0_9ZZZZ
MNNFSPISERIIKYKVLEDKKEIKLSNSSISSVSGKKIKDTDEIPQVEKVGLEIGKQIMQARLDKKIKQSDLAKQLNVTSDFIRDYENGLAPLNKIILNNIAKKLGIKILY